MGLPGVTELSVNGQVTDVPGFMRQSDVLISITMPAGESREPMWATTLDGTLLHSPTGYEAPDGWVVVSPDESTTNRAVETHMLNWSALDGHGNLVIGAKSIDWQ